MPNNGTNVPTVSSSSGSVIFSGLSPITSYTITITAVNAYGSTASAGLPVTTPAAPAPLSGGQLREFASSSDGTKLITQFNNYAIYRSSNSGVTWAAAL